MSEVRVLPPQPNRSLPFADRRSLVLVGSLRLSLLVSRPQALCCALLAFICLCAGSAHAEGSDLVSDRSSTTQKLQGLAIVALAARPMVTVYEVTSNVSEIEARAATAMFTTALIKSKQFRVMERSKIANGVAREREMNQTGVSSGNSATKQIKGANVIFEATISEATASKSSSSGGFSIGGMQLTAGFFERIFFQPLVLREKPDLHAVINL